MGARISTATSTCWPRIAPMGGALEQLGRQVLRAADVDAAHVELAGVGLAEVHQFTQRLVGRGRGHHHGNVEITERGDRCEILHRVERQALEEPCGHRGAVGHEEHGVAIGLGARHRVGRHHTTGTGPVLDHHRLAQQLGELLRHDARGEVAHAAGRKRHDDAHVLRRKRGLGLGGHGHAHHGGRQGCAQNGAAAEVFKFRFHAFVILQIEPATGKYRGN